jgi:hypothetical protein
MRPCLAGLFYLKTKPGVFHTQDDKTLRPNTFAISYNRFITGEVAVGLGFPTLGGWVWNSFM